MAIYNLNFSVPTRNSQTICIFNLNDENILYGTPGDTIKCLPDDPVKLKRMMGGSCYS